jgi:hypothetical protein
MMGKNTKKELSELPYAQANPSDDQNEHKIEYYN